jgi:hypothetical protein
MTHVSSSYLHSIFSPEKAADTLAWLRARVEEHREHFDIIAFRGTSGGPAFALTALLGIPVLYVRKELGHSDRWVEGCWAGRNRIAILDDFVQSGETVFEIMNRIQAAYDDIPTPELTRCFFYSPTGSWPEGMTRVLRVHQQAQVIARAEGGCGWGALGSLKHRFTVVR